VKIDTTDISVILLVVAIVALVAGYTPVGIIFLLGSLGLLSLSAARVLFFKPEKKDDE